MRSPLPLLVISVVAALSAALATPAAAAPSPEIYTSRLSNDAVGGFDTVSFFDGTPVRGDSAFQTSWKGATWKFASQANLDRFLADPAAFAPQFGGYCAWAVGQGYLAKGSPRHWRIVDGKLYLNFNRSVQQKWEADIPGHIARAEANWPGILSE